MTITDIHNAFARSLIYAVPSQAAHGLERFPHLESSSITFFINQPPLDMARVFLATTSVLLNLVLLAAAQGVDLFDENAYHTIDISLPADTWAAMQVNAREEEWERASVSIAGIDFGFEVGLRFKGSSTLEGCFQNDVLICPKLSLKMRFDRYEGPRYEPGNIRTVNFHAMAFDPSKMHEKISYKLFNDMGVPAPRSHWANLVVNGENFGVYAIVDQVDEVFMTRLDSSGAGQLYKETWPQDCPQECYADDLEEGSEDHTPILTFQTDMTSELDGCRLSTLSEYFDVQQLYNHFAVDAAIANWDGPTGHYCPVEPFVSKTFLVSLRRDSSNMSRLTNAQCILTTPLHFPPFHFLVLC